MTAMLSVATSSLFYVFMFSGSFFYAIIICPKNPKGMPMSEPTITC